MGRVRFELSESEATNGGRLYRRSKRISHPGAALWQSRTQPLSA